MVPKRCLIWSREQMAQNSGEIRSINLWTATAPEEVARRPAKQDQLSLRLERDMVRGDGRCRRKSREREVVEGREPRMRVLRKALAGSRRPEKALQPEAATSDKVWSELKVWLIKCRSILGRWPSVSLTLPVRFPCTPPQDCQGVRRDVRSDLRAGKRNSCQDTWQDFANPGWRKAKVDPDLLTLAQGARGENEQDRRTRSTTGSETASQRCDFLIVTARHGKAWHGTCNYRAHAACMWPGRHNSDRGFLKKIWTWYP
ncbi:hypothetical protein VTK56DRAFT_7712 [Thermocarpiscus australiensis]